MNSYDLDLLGRDIVLKGLPLLLNPERLLEQLQSRIDCSHLSAFRLAYVRYKPGTNCLGRYQFKVNGQPRLAYAKIFAADAAQKLSKSMGLQEIPGPLGPGRLALPGWNLLFSFFPNDARLRSIARLADQDGRRRLLKRIFNNGGDWSDGPESVLNYKPERRLVARFVNHSGQAAVIKFYTRREFARALHLRKRRVSVPGLQLSRHIGGSKKHCANALEWLPGEPLRAWTMDLGRPLEPFTLAGRLIARFHTGPTSSLASTSSTEHSRVLDALSEQLSFLLPDLDEVAKTLAADLKAIPEQSTGNLLPVHGDFYDKQVIVNDGQLALIDTDQVQLGFADQDLGCFAAHLERHAINDRRIDPERVTALTAALVGGYRSAGGQCSESGLAAWTAHYLFKLSHHPFRDRAPDWPEQIRRILERVGELLAVNHKLKPFATGK